MSEGMKRVAVIGAGTMGNGIAHVFAQSGHTVTLVDVHAAALERAQATIDRNLDRLVAKERISAEDKAATLARLTPSTEMRGAVSDVDLVVEAVPGADKHVAAREDFRRETRAALHSERVASSGSS